MACSEPARPRWPCYEVPVAARYSGRLWLSFFQVQVILAKHHQRQRAHKREKENLNAIHCGREGELRQHPSLL